MARLVLAAVFCLTRIALAAPLDSDQWSSFVPLLSVLMLVRSKHRPTPLDAAIVPKPPRKYEKFADNVLYLGFNTIKVGLGLGMFTLVLTVTERLARWLYRHVRGSIQYWRDEIKDIKNGGMDSDQAAWEKDEFVNEPDGWDSDYVRKKNRTAFFRKKRNPRPVKWITE
jgi:hypothetical protein